MTMTAALLVVTACCAIPTSTVEQHGVRIETSISAGIYTWTITNVDAPPIMRCQIGQSRTYDKSGPDGWEVDQKDGDLQAWTDQLRFAIDPARSKSFKARVGSVGAVLTLVDVTLGFEPGRDPITIERVWGPRRPPKSLCMIIAATVTGIGAFHAWMVGRRGRLVGRTAAPRDL